MVGGILGGGSGAAKGAAIGGAAGTGAVLATRGKDVVLTSGTTLAATLLGSQDRRAAPLTHQAELAIRVFAAPRCRRHPDVKGCRSAAIGHAGLYRYQARSLGSSAAR